MREGPKVVLEGVTKVYAAEKENVTALEAFDLSVCDGEVVSVVGPSGCGKTTVLNLVAGFVEATEGRVLVDGGPPALPRSSIGVVFQADSVFPWMSVGANVGYGLQFNGSPEADRDGIVNHHLERVGLNGLGRRWPRELSGGMRKRVDLARAYAANPNVLLLDEPFGSLDVLTKEEMQIVFARTWSDEQRTALFVTHDVEEAIFVSTRVAVMTPHPGRVKAIFDVPFGLRRDSSVRFRPEFLELRRRITAEIGCLGVRK
jgi:NitT/TauT family transport system ATP-binding protein